MQQEVLTQEKEVKISPEALEVANCYLTTLSIHDTALALDLPDHVIAEYVNKREVKAYVDAIFLDRGYMNRYKLQDLLENIIDEKIIEMKDSGVYSSKDIVDIIKLANDMRKSEMDSINKTTSINKQVNIQQNNYNDQNYVNLLSDIMSGKQ